MYTYIFRRLLLMFPTLIGITVVVFAVMASSPSGVLPPALMAQADGSAALSPEERHAMEAEIKRLYGLDRPVWEQYLRWLNNVSPFGWEVDEDGRMADWPWFKEPYLGESMISSRPVLDLVFERVWITILLNLLTVPLIYGIAITIGIYAARHRGGKFDVISGTTMLGLWSVPVMWAGVMLIGFTASAKFLRLFPTNGLHSPEAGSWYFLPYCSDMVITLQIIVCIALLLAGFPWLLYTRMRASTLKPVLTGVALAAGTAATIMIASHGGGYETIAIVFGVAFAAAVATAALRPPDVGARLAAGGSLIFLCVIWFGQLVAHEAFQPGWLMDFAWHLLLPVMCLTYSGFAFLAKLTRTAVLENILADYSRTARAKGVPENRILWGHVFRNSLLPLITVASTLLPAMLTGSVIVEQIFSIDGMGRLTIEAVKNHDQQLVLSTTLVMGGLTLISYLIADICYAIADPRVSYD